MIFLLDIEEKMNKISMIKNVYNLNKEYNLINSSNNNLQQFNKDNLNSLIEEFNDIDEISIYKILSLINEKRVLNNNNYFHPINDLNHLLLQYLNNTTNNLITSENNKVKEIYSTLFNKLILNQRRKDYRGFLNYLIMTSEPKLLDFIKNREDNLKYIENDKTSINIICQNFEKILMKYSDYTIENINEIQMMIFYFYFNGNNILSNNENDIQIIIDQENGIEKIILNNYEQKVINFREIIPDYFPIFSLDEEFMKNFMNFFKDKLNTFLLFINEMKQIKQSYKLKNQKEENINVNNENNDEKKIDNNEDEMVNINNNENDNKNMDININDEIIQNPQVSNEFNINNQEENEIPENNDNTNNEYNLNEPFIYNSQNDFFNQNKINNNETKLINTQENKNKINENNENKDLKNNKKEKKVTNIIKNKTIPEIKPNQEKIQMKYNIIQLSRILTNIIYIKNIFPKKIDFMKALINIQYSSKTFQIYKTIESILFRHQIKSFFKLIKKSKKNKKDKSRSKSKKSLKKILKKEEKNGQDEQENDESNKKALRFYYCNLKKKIFMIFKFNHFCNKEYITKSNEINFNEIINKYNDSNDSDIYKFFHGEQKPNLNKGKNNNNIQIDNHNNSINMNNINQKNMDNPDENENKIIVDYTKDKNYNNAMKLRNILDNEKEIIEEENNEELKLYNSEQPKNEVDELLNSLKSLYKEIDGKSLKTNKSIKSNTKNEYDKKNKEFINKLREVREKEKEKVRKRIKKFKGDENKLLGCPNFIKNTYSSVIKNIY